MFGVVVRCLRCCSSLTADSLAHALEGALSIRAAPTAAASAAHG
jgi:hypothetical protein